MEIEPRWEEEYKWHENRSTQITMQNEGIKTQLNKTIVILIVLKQKAKIVSQNFRHKCKSFMFVAISENSISRGTFQMEILILLNEEAFSSLTVTMECIL